MSTISKNLTFDIAYTIWFQNAETALKIALIGNIPLCQTTYLFHFNIYLSLVQHKNYIFFIIFCRFTIDVLQ